MARPSLREQILTEGLKVVHDRGFGAASVRDIVRAAGVPQGSFTNHFASKEAFGLEVLNLYYAESRAITDETLRNTGLPPLERLSAWIDRAMSHGGQVDPSKGCMIGNLSAEMSSHSETLRLRLVEIIAEVRADIAACLADAVRAGDLPADFDVAEAASFVQSGLQGATLVAKAEHDCAAVARFKNLLFRSVLR